LKFKSYTFYLSIENDATRDVFVNMTVPEVNPCVAYKVPAMLRFLAGFIFLIVVGKWI